jgi:hypothetical protein
MKHAYGDDTTRNFHNAAQARLRSPKIRKPTILMEIYANTESGDIMVLSFLMFYLLTLYHYWNPHGTP